MSSAPQLDGVLDALLEVLAERVAEKLGSRATTVKAAFYTTAKGGIGIPGKSHDWMIRHLKSMPGSRKVGRDWTISVGDYEAWAAARDRSRRRVVKSNVRQAMDDEAYAVSMLEHAGYRVPKSPA